MVSLSDYVARIERSGIRVFDVSDFPGLRCASSGPRYLQVLNGNLLVRKRRSFRPFLRVFGRDAAYIASGINVDQYFLVDVFSFSEATLRNSRYKVSVYRKYFSFMAWWLWPIKRRWANVFLFAHRLCRLRFVWMFMGNFSQLTHLETSARFGTA
jgi:hypothetical protein